MGCYSEDISEERVTSIFTIETVSNRYLELSLLSSVFLVALFVHSSFLKMELVCYLVTSVNFYQILLRHSSIYLTTFNYTVYRLIDNLNKELERMWKRPWPDLRFVRRN